MPRIPVKPSGFLLKWHPLLERFDLKRFHQMVKPVDLGNKVEDE